MPRQKKIAFQGEPGANSHLACNEVYPGAEAVPCATFEDCFAALREGCTDLAMIQIDNSLAGRVADIHHLLPSSGFHIIGEHFLRLRFQLMAQSTVIVNLTVEDNADPVIGPDRLMAAAQIDD